MSNDAIADFLRTHEAAPVGATPTLPLLEPTTEVEEEKTETFDLEIEYPREEWRPRELSEAPAKEGEYPLRFIDGCHAGQPVLCLTVRGRGWPIPLYLAEVGAISLKLVGGRFEREFHRIDRVLSFVADPFPWEEVETFAAAIANNPAFGLRVLAAELPKDENYSRFDYEVMRRQAEARAQYEMVNLERLAAEAGADRPTLVDGPLNRLGGSIAADSALRVGLVKLSTKLPLHDQGMRTLLALKPGQRTPVYFSSGNQGGQGGAVPVAAWFVRMVGGNNLAPNWGFVRVEVPWVQFKGRFRSDFTFVDRLSRWLIDARCRAGSYSRMPVSLEPIVRAEDALKPLFTPLPVLVNRLYRQAGLFRGTER